MGESHILTRLQRVEDLLVRLDTKVTNQTHTYTPSSTTTHHSLEPATSLQDIFAEPVRKQTETEAAHIFDTQVLESVGCKDSSLVGFRSPP